MLTLEGYEASSRVAGALAKRAEEIYGDFSADQQRIARRILLRLVQPGDHTEDTRRRALVGDLPAVRASSRDVEAVINAMADSRLLVTSREASTGARQVEITHEALIRGWPRLRSWIDSDRELLREHLRLTQAAAEWEVGGRDPALLFRGVRLAGWDERDASALNLAEQRFLDASRDRERGELTARRRRVRAAFAGMTAAVAVIGVFAVLALHQSSRAEEQRRIAQHEADVATSRELAADAAGRLHSDLEQALLAGLEAYRIAPTTEARAGLIASLLKSPRLLATLQAPQPGTQLNDVAFTPGGRLVAASANGTVRLWDVARDRLVERRPRQRHARSRVSPSIPPAAEGSRPRGSTAGRGCGISIDAVRSVSRLARGRGELVDVAFAPLGATLAAVSSDGAVQFWDLRRHTLLWTGRGPHPRQPA